ncbi:MAG: ABC transporter substrate-binding protein [Azoarcus sp.]|jgi:ABC-type nitrate/sulfonate/bicarbonate transport system substrate-binding protein|nr:ABC transporter substrate-binding protein [Azoarcus sp.]
MHAPKLFFSRFSSPLFSPFLSLFAAFFLLAGCAKDDAPVARTPDGTLLEQTQIRYLGAAGYVDVLELAADLGYLDPLRLEYVGISQGGPQGIQTLLSGDVDISSSSFNSAIVKVVASGAPVIAVIASYGYDTPEDSFLSQGGYFVREDSGIDGPRDLIGKKIAVNALGAQAELYLSEYMLRGGLTKNEIKQVELIVIPPVSMEQSLRQGQVDVAQFYWPSAQGGVRKLFSSEDLFSHFTAGSYMMSSRYLRANPNTARHVVGGMAKAIEWARSRPRAEVHERFRQIIARRDRNENDRLIPFFTGYGIPSRGGVLKDEDFEIWRDWLIADGQIEAGAVELKKVYTNAFNPYASDKDTSDKNAPDKNANHERVNHENGTSSP